MDDQNIIVNNQFFRETFNDILNKIGAALYSENTIQKCFTKLAKLSLIIPQKGNRGAYQINPIYFAVGDEMSVKNSERDTLVRDNLEKDNQLPLLKTSPGKK